MLVHLFLEREHVGPRRRGVRRKVPLFEEIFPTLVARLPRGVELSDFAVFLLEVFSEFDFPRLACGAPEQRFYRDHGFFLPREFVVNKYPDAHRGLYQSRALCDALHGFFAESRGEEVGEVVPIGVHFDVCVVGFPPLGICYKRVRDVAATQYVVLRPCAVGGEPPFLHAFVGDFAVKRAVVVAVLGDEVSLEKPVGVEFFALIIVEPAVVVLFAETVVRHVLEIEFAVGERRSVEVAGARYAERIKEVALRRYKPPPAVDFLGAEPAGRPVVFTVPHEPEVFVAPRNVADFFVKCLFLLGALFEVAVGLYLVRPILVLELAVLVYGRKEFLFRIA